MKFKNFKVEDENDDDNAGLTSTHKFNFKLTLKAPEQKFKGTTQSLGNSVSKKLQSNENANNNETDNLFYLPTENVNKLSTSVTSISQTTNVDNGNGLELLTLFEPKESITVTPIEVQSPLNFDDILEISSSITNDEDFTTSISINYYVTSSEKSTNEHKQHSNSETPTTIPAELFSVVEQTDNPSKTVSTLPSSNNDNGNTEKSDEFGVLETISFDQDLEEPAKITIFHLTSTSSTIPSLNTQIIAQNLTLKELQNLNISTTNNENDEILYSTAGNATNQVSALKTNSYDTEHPTDSFLTTFPDMKLLQTDLKEFQVTHRVTNTGMPTEGLNSETNNYGENINVVTHNPTNDGRVTLISELPELGTWPALTSKNLNESMPKLSTVIDELLGGLPSKVLTDENMAISHTRLESTATPMEGNEESKKLQNILITTNKLYKETQVKDNTNGEEVTSKELLTGSELSSAALAKNHGNLPTQIISETSFEVTNKVENLPYILQSTREFFNYFKLKATADEDMIPTQPSLATEEDILLKILETAHYPFIYNKFKIPTDENMILQELGKTTVTNFEVNTESSTGSALVTLDETDTTAEKLKNILMTKNNLQEGNSLKLSSIGNVVSDELEFTTLKTHVDENKDLLTSSEVLTSSELTTINDNSPRNLTIKDGITITLVTPSEEHNNVLTQIMDKTSEEKTTQNKFNEFMIKKITNEDMVSNKLVLATEVETFSQVLKTTHNPFIENILKVTTDENMYLQKPEKSTVNIFKLNTESSSVSDFVTSGEKDTTVEKFENILMTKNNLQEGTQFNASSKGNVVSEDLEFTTFQTHTDRNKNLLTSNELLTSSEVSSKGDNFLSHLTIIDETTITSATLSEEHNNVLTQLMGETSKVTGEIEKSTRGRFNEFMLKKSTNEDMVSSEPVLTTEVENLLQILKTAPNPLIENKLKITTDENMYLHELEKTIVGISELNTESSTASALVKLEKTDTTAKSNLHEGTQLNASSIEGVVSEEPEFTTFQTHIDENKDLLTSNELLTSSEVTRIGDNFPNNLTIKDGNAITLATLSEQHNNVPTHIMVETSKVTGEVEKTTRDRFNEFMLKETTNEDMVSSEPVLTTEVESLSQVLKPTYNPFIDNKVKVTTNKNMLLPEPEKTIVTNFAENKESSTISAHISQITSATKNVLNPFQESTNKNAETELAAVITKNENENKVFPDLTITVQIAPHILTKTTVGLFNEFQFKETTVSEDMATIEPHSATTLTNLPHILKTTNDSFVVIQSSETTNENMFSKEAELTTTGEETASNLLVTAQHIHTSEAIETTNIYVEGSKEPSAKLSELPTVIEETTRSENLEHIATDETHFKENTDLVFNELKLTEIATHAEENMNEAAKFKGEYTNSIEVLSHISKTTHSLLKNFLVERTTDEDMIPQGPEKTSFKENEELSTESEHALQTTAVESFPNIVRVTTKQSDENQFHETTKFAENNVLPDLTTTVTIASHILTETPKNLFQEFQLEETTVNEDMTPIIESHSTTTFTNLPHILETTSELFEEITNEDMLSKETELTTLSTTMEENNELLTSNLPVTTEKVDTSEVQETSTVLNELLTLIKKPTQLENIPATTELTQDNHFKNSSTTYLVSEVPKITEIASHTEKYLNITGESTITKQASEHILETTYNIFKILEPKGSTDEDMAIIEHSILPQITKIAPNVFLQNEFKQTTKNEALSSVDFGVITSTISAVENESSNNIKVKTETLLILSSNIPNAPNILTEPHEIIAPNEFKSKATEGISDLTTSNKIILNTHTSDYGTSVESLLHSPIATTIHKDLVASKALEPNTDNLSKTTYDINYSFTSSDKNLGLSDKTNAYTKTTKESTNLNKDQLSLSSYETNSESSLLSSSYPISEHNQTFIDSEEVTTKSYGNENGDWVTWPEVNSTSEKNTESTLITKLTISDLLTTESSTINEVTEIFQDVIALSTKLEESSSETSPTLPDELQLDVNQTPIEHSTNLSIIESSLESTITTEGHHFKNESNNILTNYMSSVETGETLHSFQTKDQYTYSSQNTMEWKTAYNQIKETQLEGITSPNLHYEPNADNQSKATENIDFSSTRSDNNLEPSTKTKEYLTSHETLSESNELSGLNNEQSTSTNFGMNSESSLLSSSSRLQEKNKTFLDFEELTTKSYGNENGDWITWPEINSTSDKNTVSTLLTKFTISDSVSTESMNFNDVTEIFQDAIGLSTTSEESLSKTFPTLPDELQLGFNQTPSEDFTNLSEITTAENNFESIATTLNINSFSTTERYHLKDITNNILTNYVSPIGIENTLHAFNTKDHLNVTDHLFHELKFDKTTATDIMNVKSSGQMTTQFEYKTPESKNTDFGMNTELNVGTRLEVTSYSKQALTIPDKIEPVASLPSEQQELSTTINPLFTLTEGNSEITKPFAITHKTTLLTLPEGSENTEAHDTKITHKPSEIIETYTSTLLKPTDVDHLSHSENLGTESDNALTLMKTDEITQSNQASIGSTLTNQDYQTEQHDTHLVHNLDETSEIHTSPLVKSTDNYVIVSHNETLQTESDNKLTSDLNPTSFTTEVFLDTTLSTLNSDSKITENNFNTVSHEKVLEHTENTNNSTAEVIPHLELLDEELMHFSTIGTHITTTSIFDRTTPIIHTTPLGDELLISHTKPTFLNSEDILAKHQSEIIQNRHTTLGIDQGMIGNQIIHSMSTENQMLTTVNAHIQLSESGQTIASVEHGMTTNELPHLVNTENQLLTTVNIHPEFSESSYTTFSSEHGISINELTNLISTEIQPLLTENTNAEFSESSHTTLSVEQGISPNDLTHLLSTANQPLTTVNFYPELSESSYTTVSVEQGISSNELTHSLKTEGELLTNVNPYEHLSESSHTTLTAEHALTHSVNTENPLMTAVNEHPHLSETDHTTISAEHGISPNELTHLVNTENQPLTTANEHLEFSESSHITLSSEHEIPISELTHLAYTENQPIKTVNEYAHLSESSHITLSAEHEISPTEMTHSVNTENQPLTIVNEHPHLSEIGHTTISAEHGILPNELTHLVNTENQPLTTENEDLEFSESSHTTLSSQHEIPISELTHLAYSENQPLTTVNDYAHLSESSHITPSAEHEISPTELTHSVNTENQPLTIVNEHPHLSETISAEHGISPNELTHLVNTENQPLTTANEHLEFSESSHTTLSSEHEIPISELTHLAYTENQPLKTVNDYAHLSESSHITFSAEHGIEPNKLTHSVITENQPLTIVNEHPHLSEIGHTTISAEHGISPNELTHLVNTENQPLTTANEHLEFSESSHTTLSSEHEIPISELTHLAYTENQPLKTVNDYAHLSESSHITFSAEHGIEPNKLTHSVITENQPLTIVNEHPHLSEIGHTTISAEHGISPNELTHLVNTENQPLTTANEHLEFSESSHTTLSSDHEIPINELTHLAYTENQPLKTVNEYAHLSESSHITLSAEHEILPTELTHSVNTENQPLTTVNAHTHLSESDYTTFSAEHGISPNELTHSLITVNQPLTIFNEKPHLSEIGHTTISAEHGISPNELTHSVNTENQPLATVNEKHKFSESSHTTLSSEHEIPISELTHLAYTENQPLTTVNEYAHLSESGHTTLSAEHEISPNELTHLENTENLHMTTANEHPHLSESGHTTISADHGISPNELTHLINTENQQPIIVSSHPDFSVSSHTTLSSEHEFFTNELNHSINVSHLSSTGTGNTYISSTPITKPSLFLTDHSQNIHATYPAELEISDNETSNLPTFPDQVVLKSTILYKNIHATLPAEMEISDNETSHLLNSTIQDVLKSTEYTIFEDITKHSETNQIDHTTAVSKLDILDEELIQFPSKTFIESTTYLTKLSTLPEISQNIYNNSYADLGVTSNELPHLLNTTTQLSSETAEHQIADNLHTSFVSTSIIIHGSVSNDINENIHTTSHADLGISSNELPHLLNTASTLLPTETTEHHIADNLHTSFEFTTIIHDSTSNDISQNIHITSHADLGMSSNELSHLVNTASPLLPIETAEHHIADNLHTSFDSTLIIHDSTLNNISHNIHTTSRADLDISSSELQHQLNTATQLLSPETVEHQIADNLHTSFVSTSIITHGSVSNDINENIHTTSHADLGISSNDLPHLENTASPIFPTETAEHYIADNLHTSFELTTIIHDLTSNDINQNIHTTFHADLSVSNNESLHLLNTATQLLSPETTDHQIADNLHTSFSSIPIITNTDTEVLNPTEFTVFEDITKHSETNGIDHTTNFPKLEILDEELIQLPSRPLTENTTYHTEPSILSDISQNIHTNFHSDLGITNSELPPFINTATLSLSSETTEHYLVDNLHTSLGSTPVITHGSTSNENDQNIHNTFRADLGISSIELPHLVNTSTTLISTETTEHHISDNLHTSLGSTPIIIHDLASNDNDQNIHTTYHADLGISSIELPHLVNTATTLISTETTEHHILDNLHTSLSSTSIIIHGSALNDNDQSIHTTFHADLGISSELPHLINSTTTLISTETTEHQIADNLHTSLGSTPITIHDSASNHIDQNIYTASHVDLGITSNEYHEVPHLVNTAMTLLSTETSEHDIADNLHTSFISTSIITHDSTLNDINQNIHTTAHADLGSELPHLSDIATELLPNENTNHQISNNMHTSFITPTTFIFRSTESGPVHTNSDETVLNSTGFTVFENIAKHSETNQIDHTTDIPKLEMLDEELIHLPSKLSTDHLATSGNELSHRLSTITKPLTNLNIVSPTSNNISIGTTIPSTLFVHNTDHEAKSNTENKFSNPTEDLAKHSEDVHIIHTTLISTLEITSHDLLNTENQQISDNHSSLVDSGTSVISDSGNQSKLSNTDKEFYNSTEFSVYEDLAKHSETTQINHTTVVPKLELLDEEFIQISNKSIPLTENVNHLTNHTDLTTLPVTFTEFLPLPTITLLEQMFSDFINNNTLNYTKSEMEELTTERLKNTLFEISNQNLNVSSEIFKEHFLDTESSYISDILTTNTNLITNAFSHKESDNQFLKTHSTLSELETLDFEHSTESFKENLKSFHEWLGQPSVNGTDQTTSLLNVIDSNFTVQTNLDIEVLSTNDLTHFSTLTHSTVSDFPNITNENSLHTSQHYLATETNKPTIFTTNGAEDHQSNSNSENLNPNQQSLDQQPTWPPVITMSTFPYSQNYHNENLTANEELPQVSVSREMMSFEITTLLSSDTTTSMLNYTHNYHPENFSVNQDFLHASVSREIISSDTTIFPSLITSTQTFAANSDTSTNFSTTQSLEFHNISFSTEIQNLGNFLKTDQVGNIKNDSGTSSTKVSNIPTTHESTENLSKTQNETTGDTSKNKKIDSTSSETSNLTINNLKTTGKEFEKNSNEGMWQWPEMKPESPISSSNPLAGEHAKITQPDVTIANAKFEPADNDILFTSKPNLSTTALEHHVSTSLNLVTHVTHSKLQPEMNKNIPPLEIQTGPHNSSVGNISLHQSNGKLQNAPIYINLPVYPVDSTYPLLIKFNEYYSSTTKSSVIIDDEATDTVINTEQFRTMKFEDFNAVTEFPSTTIKMEEPEISKLSHTTNQILSNSMQPTTSLNKALITNNIESNQQSVELTTKSEVTHIGKSQDKLPDILNENPNQQNAELTTKSETVHMSSTEEKINQTISNGVTEFLTLGSSRGVTHFENTSCTSSNTLSNEISSEEINKTTESSMPNAHSQPVVIISEFPKFQEESTCNYTDYLSQNNCMCSMDNLIKDLRMKLVNNFLNFSIDNFTCPIFTHVEAGIFLGNDSVPQISKSRRDVLSDMYSIVVRREIVDYQNMDRTLNEQLELKNTENDIFATPGMKILIPCISSNNLSEGSSNYSWTFSDNLPLTEGKIQETEGTLTIDNVAPQDAGNYTCIATSSNANKSDEKRYEHHLSVVSIPSYRLQTTLLYNSTEKCQSGDADIISLYLPHSLEGLICGNYFKVCSIEVKNPKCLNATQYTSVNLTVVIEPINVIMPAINNSVCDVGCEMKIYTHVVLFIIKNLEAVLKLPVFFRLSYRQQKLMPTEVVIKKTRQKLGTEAPKLIITCPPGFGYYKKTHVCGTCGRNTFSRGDETFCSPCPAGQYQPMVGSKSCLICATPLQDPYCLRVMYSNTHKFRVLIGITATVVVVLIILLLCIKSMKKSTNSRNNSKFGREAYLKNKRQSRRRTRDPDVEMQDSDPLLDCNRDRKYSKGYNRKPPEPPPPDFY